MGFTEVTANPDDIRFSQYSIAPFMATPWGENDSLQEVLKKMKNRQLDPDVFPALEVYRDEDGVLWSNDNERLWLYRMSGISQITVKVFDKRLRRAPPRSDSDRALMSRPNFFPTMREESQETASISTQVMDDESGSLAGGVIKENPKATSSSRNHVVEYFPSPRIDRNQYPMPNSDSPRIRSQETASTSTQLMANDSYTLLYGAATAAVALIAGFSTWKRYKKSGD